MVAEEIVVVAKRKRNKFKVLNKSLKEELCAVSSLLVRWAAAPHSLMQMTWEFCVCQSLSSPGPPTL